MPVEKKPVLKSKTVWVNLLVIGAGVASYIAGHELVADNAALVSVLGVVVGVVNVALRFMTDKAVK